ncbi:complexin-2 isoform X1 [Syngnathus typhle]|uniref:complexin-2 isoform X1 n=1 Tax=Syngnathus typhle TaxID=161592 RepID=UPI002A6A051B|nr:complexin-2 isoform X1 [Syngnathus typhle]XP_061146025.1 complexin-2 isoform X1 [Syngnathus typhle]XP_061146034.1 complexin-2 isoform X1 [Syngnathus typhle]
MIHTLRWSCIYDRPQSGNNKAPSMHHQTWHKLSFLHHLSLSLLLSWCCRSGATKDMGKMLGGEEEKDPDAAKKEEERQEALRQQEEERKAKHARMEAEREKVRQSIRDKYGLKKKEEKEAEEKAALEQACEGSLTRPKKAIPRGCGDDDDDDDESILDTVLKFLPGPLQDMFKK